MTLLEAIQNCGDNWLRPVSEFKGYAYRLKQGKLIRLRKNHEESIMHVISLSEINGDWEIVTPEQVLSERGDK